ncbi:ATP-binding protein [Emcibacter nanhaiensis]|uniref:histidine kinase n=1 Tax=Emcibacter nanhaiensis TaxID=1505037 RepID=A0A501PIH2_9PROT|nr:ATP-binding protein [Emcibacter nanhaiensis]TPD59801.1 HAMP domain-containing protein [Emcibacter nanhaiensis]
MKRLWTKSIRTKLRLFTASVIILVTGATTYFTTAISRQELIGQQVRDSVTSVETISSIIADDVYYLNSVNIRDYLRSLSANRNIVESFVLDHNREVLTDGTTENALRGENASALFPQSLFDQKQISAHNLADHYWVGGPVKISKEDTIGYIFVKYSLQRTNATIDKQLLEQLAIACFCAAIALFLSSIFANHITKPLADLTGKAKRIAQGEKNVALKVKGQDEIAELGHAFEQMVEHLHASNAELKELSDNLDNEVRARTAELEERGEALRDARDRAEAANRAKSNFLAVMTHELRTPMNSLLGMLDLIRSTELSDKQRDYVETAKSSGDMLLTIINDILDLSKIEANKLDLEYTSVPVEEFLEDIVDIYFYRARDKGLTIDLDISPNIPGEIETDPDRLKQVLANFMDNAIKFTEKGSVILRAYPCEIGKPLTEAICFSVRDTGKGISEKNKKNIFKEFTQEDASITRKFGGTGLGLAISKKLTELMDGVIGFESKEGEGSMFYCRLPVSHKSNGSRDAAQ